MTQEQKEILKREKLKYRAFVLNPGFEDSRNAMIRQIINSDTPKWGNLILKYD